LTYVILEPQFNVLNILRNKRDFSMRKVGTNAFTKYKLSFLPNSASCDQRHGGWVQIQVTKSTSILAVTVIVRHLLTVWRQCMAWHTRES